MKNWLLKIPWWLLAAGALTLGLALYKPRPHLFEKLNMLVNGDLVRLVDIFDLALHCAFPLLLILKLVVLVSARRHE
ncbi:MAG: RND transporter [Proteobacteria bacterium]|nr:MAG: RND transporter [Pseudomonadota bacterium]